jgi:arabinofuranosyltransferase
MRNFNRLFFLVFIIILCFSLWSSFFIYKSSVIAIDGKRYFGLFDDAMISMRYAWNLTHGLGLVWNPGERVEGYTNLLMTLWMALPTLIFNKSIAVLFIQISGFVFMIGTAFLSMGISSFITPIEKTPNYHLIRALAFSCGLLYFPLNYWSLMGMETGLLTLLLGSGILLSFEFTRKNRTNYLLLISIVLGLAFLTRNDSLIYAILIWGYVGYDVLRNHPNKKTLKIFVISIFIYILFIISQEIFRFYYYGEWLPNTFILKMTGMSLKHRIINGAGFISPFFSELFIIIVICGIDLLLDFNLYKLLIFSFFATSIGYQVYVGGDPWNYWRIIAPTIPFLLLLLLNSINSFALTINKNITNNKYKLSRRFSIIMLLSLFFTSILILNARFIEELLFIKNIKDIQPTKIQISQALVLNMITTPDAKLGVYWAGTIPYYSDRYAIDFLGKSDKYISHLSPDESGAIKGNGMKSVPGHNKYDLNYSIRQLKPTFVQFFKWGNDDLIDWSKEYYENVNIYGMNLFLQKESPYVLWGKISELNK